MRSERLKRHFQNSEQAVYKRDFGLNRQPACPAGSKVSLPATAAADGSRFFVSGYGKSVFSLIDGQDTQRRNPSDTVPRNTRKPDFSGKRPG